MKNAVKMDVDTSTGNDGCKQTILFWHKNLKQVFITKVPQKLKILKNKKK